MAAIINIDDNEIRLLQIILDNAVENLREFRDGDNYSEGEEMGGFVNGDTPAVVALKTRIDKLTP